MSKDVLESREFDYNANILFRVERLIDLDPDLSLLGEFTEELGEWRLDIKEGWLLGEWYDERRVFRVSPRSHFACVIPNDGTTVYAKSKADKEWLERELVHGETWTEAGEVGSVYVTRSGYELVKSGIRTNWNTRDYKFFVFSNHLPHDPKNWAHVSRKDKRQVINKFGSLLQADIHYALEDWERMRTYGTHWNMIGISATMFVNGREAVSHALYGVESDSDKEYIDEIEEEQIALCLSELTKFIENQKAYTQSLEGVHSCKDDDDPAVDALINHEVMEGK